MWVYDVTSWYSGEIFILHVVIVPNATQRRPKPASIDNNWRCARRHGTNRNQTIRQFSTPPPRALIACLQHHCFATETSLLTVNAEFSPNQLYVPENCNFHTRAYAHKRISSSHEHTAKKCQRLACAGLIRRRFVC